MSKVAEILAQMAQNAGQAALRRGAIIGGTVAQAADVPAQIYTDRQYQQQLDLHKAQVQQQMGLEAARGQRETAAAAHQTAADARTAQTEQHLNTIIGAGFTADPSKFDMTAATTAAQKLGRADLLPTVAAVHDKFTKQPTILKEGEAGFDPVTHQPIPGMSVEPKLNEADIAMKAAGGDTTATDAMGLLKPTPQKSIESKAVLLDGKPAIVNFNPATGKHTLPNGTDVSERIKPVPPASMTINPALVPSGDALDMAAKRYLATGDLPSMGMGQAGAAARVAVMNAAAKIDPQASLAANKAVYGADTKNLAKLQTTEGTLSAFEKTAGKNLDQFLGLASKIPDTGVPWINQPIRNVNAKLLGSADQAAFNAARDVALREIARVTNDPKLSGALTDSARAEVAGLSPENATFKQIQAVAKVLKQDMANVHAGVNEQINTVKAGLGANPAAPTSQEAPSSVPANVATALKGIAPGRHTLSDGSVWLVAADGSITKGQ